MHHGLVTTTYTSGGILVYGGPDFGFLGIALVVPCVRGIIEVGVRWQAARETR